MNTKYWYRNADTAAFTQTDMPRRIIPVRLKTPYYQTDAWYKDNKWEVIPHDLKDALQPDNEFAYCLYAENAQAPQCEALYDKNVYAEYSSRVMEDFSAAQMAAYLQYRKALMRYHYNQTRKKDECGIDIDVASYAVKVDEDALTAELTIICYDAKAKGSFDSLLVENDIPVSVPSFVSQQIIFDIKNGSAKFINRRGFSAESENLANQKPQKNQPFDILDYDEFKSYLSLFKPDICEDVIDYAYHAIIGLVRKFTGLPLPHYTDNPPQDKLLFMYQITILPFEPLLAGVLLSDDIKQKKLNRKFDRHDSLVFKNFCKKAHIDDYPFLRKCYNSRSAALLTYLRLHDGNITDINVINKVLSEKKHYNIIDDVSYSDLTFYLRYAVAHKGQIAALNNILKETDNLYDCLNMFHAYFKHVPKTLRDDILKDGFTEFNHNALSEIATKCENKNVKFRYTQHQKSLEDEIDGYVFRLPKDSDTLCEIGAALHNCVASYKGHVLKKECTIVYVTKDGQFDICIEVRGKDINQELTNRNARPTKEQQDVLDKWHERHGLIK